MKLSEQIEFLIKKLIQIHFSLKTFQLSINKMNRHARYAVSIIIRRFPSCRIKSRGINRSKSTFIEFSEIPEMKFQQNTECMLSKSLNKNSLTFAFVPNPIASCRLIL